MNANTDEKTFVQRDQSAAQLRLNDNAYEIAPSSTLPSVYDVHYGEVVVYDVNEAPRAVDQVRNVWSSLNGLAAPVSVLMDGYRGASLHEKAVKYMYERYKVAGLAATDYFYSQLVKGVMQNPTVVQVAGISTSLNNSTLPIKYGDHLFATVGPTQKENMEGVSDQKVTMILAPLSSDMVFPSQESMRMHLQVSTPAALTRMNKKLDFRAAGAALGAPSFRSAPFESMVGASDAAVAERWSNDWHTGLEAFIKTVAMHAIDLYKAQLAAPGMGGVAAVPTEELVGLKRLSQAAFAPFIKLPVAVGAALHQPSWPADTIFQKALLSLCLGYDQEHARKQDRFVRMLECNAYEVLKENVVESVRDVMSRKVGTAMSDAKPKEHFTIQISLN